MKFVLENKIRMREWRHRYRSYSRRMISRILWQLPSGWATGAVVSVAITVVVHDAEHAGRSRLERESRELIYRRDNYGRASVIDLIINSQSWNGNAGGLPWRNLKGLLDRGNASGVISDHDSFRFSAHSGLGQ